MVKHDLAKLLKTEDDQLQKLNSIVMKAIAEEKLISQMLMEFEGSNPGFSGKVAGQVSSFGGS